MAEVFGIKKPEPALTESRKRILRDRGSKEASSVSTHATQVLYAPPPGWPSLGKDERGDRSDAGAWYQLKKIADGWLVTLGERDDAGRDGAPPMPKPGADLTVELVREIRARGEKLRLGVLQRLDKRSADIESDDPLQRAIQRYRDILSTT